MGSANDSHRQHDTPPQGTTYKIIKSSVGVHVDFGDFRTQLQQKKAEVPKNLQKAMDEVGAMMRARALGSLFSPYPLTEIGTVANVYPDIVSEKDMGIDDFFEAVRLLKAIGPFVQAIWFVNKTARYYQFMRLMYPTNGFGSRRSIYDIPIVEWSQRAFNPELEIICPMGVDRLTLVLRFPHLTVLPWFCIASGIWLEMSDGRHRLTRLEKPYGR